MALTLTHVPDPGFVSSVRPVSTTMLGGKLISTEQVFEGYAARFSRETDVRAVVRHIWDKQKAKTESKQNAVYFRNISLIEMLVSVGFFTLIEKKARTEEDYKAFGGLRGIVAGVGAYPLELVDGAQHQISLQDFDYETPLKHVWELASGLHVKENDRPNKDGLLPNGCTYDMMVGLTLLNLLRRAGQIEVGSVVGNVKVDVGYVVERLSNGYLHFSLLRNPAQQLITASRNITVGADGKGSDANFDPMKQQWYRGTPDNLPRTANFLLNAIRDGEVAYWRGPVHNIMKVDFSDLPLDFVPFLKAVANNSHLFRPAKEFLHEDELAPYRDIGFSEACSKLIRPEPSVGEHANIALALQNYRPRDVESLIFDTAAQTATNIPARDAAPDAVSEPALNPLNYPPHADVTDGATASVLVDAFPEVGAHLVRGATQRENGLVVNEIAPSKEISGGQDRAEPVAAPAVERFGVGLNTVKQGMTGAAHETAGERTFAAAEGRYAVGYERSFRRPAEPTNASAHLDASGPDKIMR